MLNWTVWNRTVINRTKICTYAKVNCLKYKFWCSTELFWHLTVCKQKYTKLNYLKFNSVLNDLKRVDMLQNKTTYLNSISSSKTESNFLQKIFKTRQTGWIHESVKYLDIMIWLAVGFILLLWKKTWKD